MDRDVTSLPKSAIAPETDKKSGFGTLETDRGRLPLTAMNVTARISGLMTQIQLRQSFRNSLDETLEATYIFPLPDRAAVTRFQMRVAGRTIDGELKERGQAREEYNEAIARGHRAAIAEEDRSGVFQLRVGNLPPREEAVVELTLVSPLPVADGEATFRFPLVVAPRYTPGIPLDGPSVGSGVTPDTDQVPDASRVTHRSGSMQGWKLVAARRAVGRMVDTLLGQDEFTVLAFDNVIEELPIVSNGFVSGTDRHRWQALEWLGKVGARGGTEMGPAVEMALKRCGDAPAGHDPIVILVTDGQTSGEDAILRGLSKWKAKKIPLPRFFAVGIDRAVNAGFLRRLADFGQGECELVESEDRLDEAMDRIHRLMGRPLLTQVRLEPSDGRWVDGSLAPQRLPDLYYDRPVTVFGRHHGGNDALALQVHALGVDGQPWQQQVSGQAADVQLLRSLWGRAKVRELEDEYAAGPRNPEQLMQRIVNVSLESHVLSRFTAYVAVDRSETVGAGGQPRKIVQPVDLPDGWDSMFALGESCFTELARERAGCFRAFSVPPHEYGGRIRRGESAGRVGEDDSRLVSRLMARAPLGEDTWFEQPSARARSQSRRQIQKRYLAELAKHEPDATRNVVLAILKAAVHASAGQIVVGRLDRWVRIRLEKNGESVEYVQLPAGHFRELLRAVCNLASIDSDASSWPQQRQAEVEGVRLTVMVDLTPSWEGAVITIAPQQPGEPSAATARKRFWT